MEAEYNKTRSKTYKNTTDYRISFRGHIGGCRAEEKFEFYDDFEMKNTVKIEKIPFTLVSGLNLSFCPFVGLQLSPNPTIYSRSLPGALISSNYTSDSTFSFFFLSENRGFLVVGEAPHIFSASKFRAEELRLTSSFVDGEGIAWGVEFGKVAVGGRALKKGLKAKFSLDIEGIIGTEEFMQAVEEEFFEVYFKRGVCFKKGGYLDGEIFDYISCEKGKFLEEDVGRLPEIKFFNVPLNTTFILTGKDLFRSDLKEIKFLVIAKKPYKEKGGSKLKALKNSEDGWIFGRIFLMKNQLSFNIDAKMIGIYAEKRTEKEKNYMDFLFILAIFILCFLVFLMTVLYFKVIKLTRKKTKMNELEDDNYRYMSNKEMEMTESKGK